MLATVRSEGIGGGWPVCAFHFRDARGHLKEDSVAQLLLQCRYPEEEATGVAPNLVLGMSSWKSDEVFHLGAPCAGTAWQWEQLPRLRRALRRAGERVGHVLVQCAPDELAAVATALEAVAGAPELADWQRPATQARLLVLFGAERATPGESKTAAASPGMQMEVALPGKSKIAVTADEQAFAAHAESKHGVTKSTSHARQPPAAERLLQPLFMEYRDHRGPRVVLSTLSGNDLVRTLLRSDLCCEGHEAAAPPATASQQPASAAAAAGIVPEQRPVPAMAAAIVASQQSTAPYREGRQAFHPHRRGCVTTTAAATPHDTAYFTSTTMSSPCG